MLDKLKDFFGKYEANSQVEYIVAGLGNPGRKYENTRHNAGFMALDYLQKQEGFEMKRLRFKALCGDATIAGKRVLFLKPSTFMNKSGESVRDAMQYYNVPPERTIILFDDISIDVGKLRIRVKGSDGGQKGMQNIIYLTGDDQFPRVRVGIGKKRHPDMKLADWVLSRFTPDELQTLDTVFENAAGAVRLMVNGDINQAMNRYNR